MSKKLFFEVESHEVIANDEDSHFATARILAFSSGLNRHDYVCKEETLQQTASTLDYKPIVYMIDHLFQDFGTHAKEADKSLISGFVIPGSQEFERLEDGRLGLFVSAKIWKKYASAFMRFMERDGGEKPVSVEMDLYEASQDMSDPNIQEMKDFEYNAICILGDAVTEASPGANLKMLSFAKEQDEYNKIFVLEFGKYEELDFTIPQKVKENAKRGLELRKEYGRGSTSVGVATARYLISNKTASPEKVRHIAKYFPRHEGDNLDDKTSNGWISWCIRQDTEIMMADGTHRTIGDICKNKVTDPVLTYNEQTGKIEPKKITNWFINPSTKDEFIQMGSSVGNRMGISKKNNLFLTKDHEVYTSHGWVESKDMADRKYNYLDYVPNNMMEQVIDGILLGDASITKDGRIVFTHCKKQEMYGDEILRILEPLGFTKKEFVNGYGNKPKVNVNFQYRSKVFSYFEKRRSEIYPSGKKEVSKEFLSRLTPMSIAFWVMDDGSLHFDKRTNNPDAYSYRLHIEGFDDISARNIHEYFMSLGIQNSIIQRENTDGKVIYFSRSGSKKLAQMISSYVHSSMRYKLPDIFRDVKYDIDYSKFDLELGIFEKDVTCFNLGSEIKNRQVIKPRMCKFKYDIEVEDNHNFFANGILIHNCIWGGNAGRSWSTKLVKQMDKKDSENMSFFAEDEISKKEEKPKMIKDKEEPQEEEMAAEETPEETSEENMATEEQEPSENPEEEKMSEDEGEDEETEEPESEDMSLDAYADVPAMLALLEAETDQNRELARSYAEEKSVNWEVMAKALYAKASRIKEESGEKEKAYMSENDKLKEFKLGIEKEQFNFAVGKIISEVEKVLPKDKLEEVKEDVKNFSLETLDSFKNKTLALAFEFSNKKNNENKDEFVIYGFPVSNSVKSDSPWG